MKNIFKEIGKSFGKAKPRKHYLEFITAALSIPVLLTVILVNWNSLKGSNSSRTNTPSPEPRQIIIKEDLSSNSKNPTPTNLEICKKEIGPISISYPREGSTITENPVNFIIRYENSEFCSVVWSYRINGGSWSEFTSNSPSIFNLPNGNVKFELRVQSTVSQDTDQLDRNFKYEGNVVSTPTLSPTPAPTTNQ